jgi:thioredoxin-like negative regulator of GroEL
MTKITTREELAALSGTSLIIVTASWCSFSKICNEDLSKIDISLLGNIIRLDLDNNKELCEYLNIKCSPTVLILDNQIATDQVSGRNKIKHFLEQMILKSSKKKYTSSPLLQATSC